MREFAIQEAASYMEMTRLSREYRHFSVNRAVPISVLAAFGPHSWENTVNATVGGWPSGSTVCFPTVLFPEVLNAKKGNSIYHFSSLWYDWTGY